MRGVRTLTKLPFDLTLKYTGWFLVLAVLPDTADQCHVQIRAGATCTCTRLPLLLTVLFQYFCLCPGGKDTEEQPFGPLYSLGVSCTDLPVST